MDQRMPHQLTLAAIRRYVIVTPALIRTHEQVIPDLDKRLTRVMRNRLISACAACQGAGWVKWSEWSADCGVASVDDVGE